MEALETALRILDRNQIDSITPVVATAEIRRAADRVPSDNESRARLNSEIAALLKIAMQEYRTVVEAGFSGIADLMEHYWSQPIRMLVEVEPAFETRFADSSTLLDLVMLPGRDQDEVEISYAADSSDTRNRRWLVHPEEVPEGARMFGHLALSKIAHGFDDVPFEPHVRTRYEIRRELPIRGIVHHWLTEDLRALAGSREVESRLRG